MKNTKLKLIAWIGLLVIGLLPIGTQAALHHQSGIIGFVDSGQFEGGLMPGVWAIVVCSDTGKLVTALNTDEEGLFCVDLKPGNYVLRASLPALPYPGQPLSNIAVLGPSKSVKVVNNRLTFVDLKP